MQKGLHVIDVINEWMGRTAGWLLIPLSFLVLFDVILRYVLNMATIWVWDVGVQIQAAIVVLGGGYALLHKGHVSVDILISKLPTRKRALLDAIMYIFLVGGIAILLWRLSISAQYALSIKEHWTSTWAPVVYPLKVLIVVGVGALLLQAIANWIRIILTLIHGDEVARQ
ncbi:MAG: TRAP transporter small permease subunit [Dehalococcoidia bacterium]|nr:TRAP transporter small permease subunit [Dehalococcoidia bacterium]